MTYCKYQKIECPSDRDSCPQYRTRCMHGIQPEYRYVEDRKAKRIPECEICKYATSYDEKLVLCQWHGKGPCHSEQSRERDRDQ